VIQLSDILWRISGTGLNDLELAEKTDINNSTFGKWRKGGNASQDSLTKVKAWLDKEYPLPDWFEDPPVVSDRLSYLEGIINRMTEHNCRIADEIVLFKREVAELRKSNSYQQHIPPMGTKDDGG
jgi:transcriptional regulator with XRE-family HTH domain